MSDFEKQFNSFIEKLKQKDEQLFYEFVNLWDNSVGKIEKIQEKILESDKKILESDLRLEKIDNERNDLHIEIMNKFHKYKLDSQNIRQELNQIKTNTENKFKEKNYDMINEYMDKYWDNLDNVSKAIFNRPRTMGFLLLLFGRKQYEMIKIAKLDEQNTKRGEKNHG